MYLIPASSSEAFASLRAMASPVSRTVTSSTSGSFVGCGACPETKATWQSAQSVKPSSYSAKHFGQYMLCLPLNNKSCPRGKHTPAAKDDVGPLQTEKGQHPGLGAAGGLGRDHLCNGDFSSVKPVATSLSICSLSLGFD